MALTQTAVCACIALFATGQHIQSVQQSLRVSVTLMYVLPSACIQLFATGQHIQTVQQSLHESLTLMYVCLLQGWH